MTYYSKLKTSILPLLLGTFLMLSFDCLAVPGLCIKNLAREIIPTLNADNNFDCFTAPSDQRVLFYKIAFCKATTLAVPANAAGLNGVTSVDRSSCTTMWQNTAGAEVSVMAGAMNTFPGTITMPPPGTYNSIYVEVDPTFAYAWSGTIATTNGFAVATTTDLNNPVNDTTGKTCFTNGGKRMNNQEVGDDKPSNITCNNGPAAPVPSIINNNVFGLIGNPLVSVTSEVGQVPVNGTQTFSAALINQATGAVLPPGPAINSLNVLVTSPSPRSPVKGTTVIGAWMTKTLNITPSTTSFAVKMSNTQGMAIQFGNDNNNPNGWDGRINGAVNGTFDFDLTIQ